MVYSTYGKFDGMWPSSLYPSFFHIFIRGLKELCRLSCFFFQKNKYLLRIYLYLLFSLDRIDVGNDGELVSSCVLCRCIVDAHALLILSLLPPIHTHTPLTAASVTALPQTPFWVASSFDQVRVLRKCPELVEEFVDRVAGLLLERSHGVVLSGVQVNSYPVY